jgi:hypothetical protein
VKVKKKKKTLPPCQQTVELDVKRSIFTIRCSSQHRNQRGQPGENPTPKKTRRPSNKIRINGSVIEEQNAFWLVEQLLLKQ